MLSILISGGAGFIGYHLQEHLRKLYGVQVFDLLLSKNYATCKRASNIPNIIQGNILDNFIDNIPSKPDMLIHLAAETGIPESTNDPKKYLETNVMGTFNVLEQCRKNGIKRLIYASSSSVYSPNQEIMFENSNTHTQLSFYGTTKKMAELMVENYCKQFGITAIGLRFFTVYGSWTRPDMAAYKFMKAIHSNQPITLYNNGQIYRDFTHVSDIVKSIELLIEKMNSEPLGFHKIFNIGYGKPITVKRYADLIAENFNLPLVTQSAELPLNELLYTHANIDELYKYIGYSPMCSPEIGIKEMTDWFINSNYE